MNINRPAVLSLVVLLLPLLSSQVFAFKAKWPKVTPAQVIKAAQKLTPSGQKVQVALMQAEQKVVDNAKIDPVAADKLLGAEMKAYCVEHASGAGGDRATSIRESYHSRISIDEVRTRVYLQFGDGHVYWVKVGGCELHKNDPL